MNRDELKEFFRTLHRSTAVEQNKSAMITEGQHSGRPEFDGTFDVEEEELYDIDNYDVEELASYHALNGDVDATLYRDNPDYRRAFIEMIITTHGEGHEKAPSGRPHLDYGSLEAEDDALDALRNPGAEISRQQSIDDMAMQGGDWYGEEVDEDTEDDDLVMGQVPYSEDYQNMIDDIESRRGRPYDID
jgi:hypothetical protein